MADFIRFDHSKDERGLTSTQLALFLRWLQPLQRSLSLETESRFRDLQGRKQRFHQFLSQQLSAPPAIPMPRGEIERMERMRCSFDNYPQLTDASRQRLVSDSRQWLYELRRRLEPSAPMTPPRIKLQNLLDRRSTTNPSLGLDSPIARIRGVDPKLASRLASLDLVLVKDLLHHYPRDHVDYSSMRRIEALVSGETATIVAKILRCNGFVSPRNPNLAILELRLQDPTGWLKVTKFSAGKRFSSPAYLKRQQRLYPVGASVAVSGLVKNGAYGLSFQDPLIEVLDSPSAPVRSASIGRLFPVYALTEGVRADRFRSLIEQVLPLTHRWPEHLPSALRKQFGLMSIAEALEALHAPKNRESLDRGRHRLIFDEFLLLQLGLLQRRQALRSRPGPDLVLSRSNCSLVRDFRNLLSFQFTDAQQRVLHEIEEDLADPKPMARLIQGDVGSGKTVVAIAALLSAVSSGWQGALIAPTEVLAEQHYQTLCQWLPQLHVTVELLTGSTPRSRRRRLLDNLFSGSLKLLVGTHALLEDSVVFHRLGLVVVDEQHRFGVHQRGRLLSKGLQPHMLTITATPIPRTLALSIHGDLDVSQIDELPPGRTPIQTAMLSTKQREKAYKLIRKEVEKGQRAYVVLPLVEESDRLTLRSAITVHAELASEVFPDLRVGLLHGRLSSREKQSVLSSFVSGDCQVLVSTTVVEVGVDIPEASVMVIDHAERFGLAQLHQLRGRVGRGAAASHCLLINGSPSPLASQRLDILVRSTDGFEIAEMDLKLRGPGQVLGTRQSGLPDLALASLAHDAAILEDARIAAQELLRNDPGLERCPRLRQLLANQQRRLSGDMPLN
ncbi:ATP-dependent DNA helicase RecG [Synechococcus sp. M16CYN]|uniref:ATP-dependent DNA helicase RecG n=1 Tax=Synechococcus sp. M16CYN TaxID=3103139 RepID=UPI003246BCA7